jgi:hypothetical protein
MWQQDPETTTDMRLTTVFTRALAAQRTPHAVLKQTVELATAHLPGAAAVTIVLPDGSADTLSTSTPASALDRAQHRHGQGPTLQACADQSLLHVPDLATEPRWPAFVHDARQLGVATILACSLGSWSGGRAALSLYATVPHAFDPAAVRRAALLAEHTARALADAGHAASLHTALRRRLAIGEATGILAERHGLDVQTALALLVGAAQRLDVALQLVAEHVVRTGCDPGQITADDLPGPPAPLAAAAGEHPPGHEQTGRRTGEP